MTELELQYVYEGPLDPVVPAELAGLVLTGSQSVMIVDTYYDTADLLLRRSGCSLRVRAIDSRPPPLLAWKSRSKRENGSAKKRTEIELPILAVPDGPADFLRLLADLKLHSTIREVTGLEDEQLVPIGELRNERSIHAYVQGLHRLELSWDRLSYPVGPSELRLELEAKSQFAERYLEEADTQLHRLFTGDLAKPPCGKVRELCNRLYPELLAR